MRIGNQTIKSLHLIVALLFALSFSTACGVSLEDEFRNPPDSAGVWTYWFWVDGNVTREGITTDLEAMARVGIKGVLIMDCLSKFAGVPKGPVEFLSPEWREMFKHALNEANRLGLQVSMNNDAGWTGSGGPWNTPEHSMQIIVSSEIKIEGGRRFEEALPQPRTVGGFYRDIAVLALRQPKSTSQRPSPSRLTATSSECIGFGVRKGLKCLESSTRSVVVMAVAKTPAIVNGQNTTIIYGVMTS